MLISALYIVLMIYMCAMISKSFSFSVPRFRRSITGVYPQAKRLFSMHIRPSANDLSLDANLLSSQPDLVISHLQSRNSDPLTLDKVFAIKDLQSERKSFIFNGDAAKNIRKTLSKEIGALMKVQKLDEVDVLKAKVEAARNDSDAADEALVGIEKAIHDIIASLPNLLDDRLVTHRTDHTYLTVFRLHGAIF